MKDLHGHDIDFTVNEAVPGKNYPVVTGPARFVGRLISEIQQMVTEQS